MGQRKQGAEARLEERPPPVWAAGAAAAGCRARHGTGPGSGRDDGVKQGREQRSVAVRHGVGGVVGRVAQAQLQHTQHGGRRQHGRRVVFGPAERRERSRHVAYHCASVMRWNQHTQTHNQK